GHRGHAGTAADGRGPYTERQGAAARRRPDLYDWDGVLGPPGVDRAALPPGVAIARRGERFIQCGDAESAEISREISAEISGEVMARRRGGGVGWEALPSAIAAEAR